MFFSRDRLENLDELTQSNISLDVIPEWTSRVSSASFRASHVVILNSHWKMHIRARCACRWINEVCHVVLAEEKPTKLSPFVVELCVPDYGSGSAHTRALVIEW